MRILRFVFKDWVLGIWLTLLVLGASSLEYFPLNRLDYAAYDVMSRMRKSGAPADVVIVAVDEKSEEAQGSWPWPRAHIASLVERLQSYGPKVVGVDIFYPERESIPGLASVRKVSENLKNTKGKATRELYRSLKEAERQLEGDSRLVSSAKSSGNVVYPFLFAGTGKAGEDEVPPFLEKNSLVIDTPPVDITRVKADLLSLKNPLPALIRTKKEAKSVKHPFGGLAAAARSLGHGNVLPDGDGTVRHEALLVPYRGRYYPSFALQVALAYLNNDTRPVAALRADEAVPGIGMGETHIPTDGDFRMLPNFGGREKIPAFSSADVMGGTVEGKEFRGKAVLVGYTGTGARRYPVPSGQSLSAVEIAAGAVDSIIRDNHIVRPRWAFGIEFLVIAYFGVFVSFILPRVGVKVGGVLIILSILPAFAAAAFLFFSLGYWVMLFSPSLLISAGYLSIVMREYVSFGKRSAKEADTIESNKMLGLSFQNQGLLDLALEKFMKCPVKDQSVKVLLYNLALDFERKRMPARAIAVYEHILKAGSFKDAKKRARSLGAAEGTAVISRDASGRGTMMQNAGTGANPTLGRYEILRELGRGSMGMVFLGRDPKINREVAIKTLTFADVEEGQLAEVKKRFSQEAEAAGRLSHPNIVTIYDAGEEHDMAYMAMELLAGSDLRSFCSRGNLLPSKEVMRIIADVADALDYGHKKGVIHRDIKPANIMLLDGGTVKVTDFGIARIVEHSTTHTRMIQGTPGYMSPEQVNGEKVGPQSDLFSLGAVFYELLSGKKAFPGDGVSSILYRISKGDYLALSAVARKVPSRLNSIVKKLLATKTAKRYKRGADVAKDIRALLDGRI